MTMFGLFFGYCAEGWFLMVVATLGVWLAGRFLVVRNMTGQALFAEWCLNVVVWASGYHRLSSYLSCLHRRATVIVC